MGKGDKKSRRGKISIGSFGVSRKRKPARGKSLARAIAAAEAPVKEKKHAVKHPETAPPAEVKQEKPKAQKTKKKVEEPAGDLFTGTTPVEAETPQAEEPAKE